MGRRHSSTADAGFTTIELMVVVGMAAIILSILAMGIRQATESYALRRAGTLVLSELRRAQTAATADGVNYTVEFVLGSPGSLNVYRPGVQADSVVSVHSDGADARDVTVLGTTAGRVVTETLQLDGTTLVVGTQTFEWVMQVETSADSASRTITVRRGAAVSSPVLTTIAGVGTTAATLPWTLMRRISAADWPSRVAIATAGTTFGACAAPPGSGANKCAIFLPLGYPQAGGNVLLCDSRRVPLRVSVADATGRVRLERAGTCP